MGRKRNIIAREDKTSNGCSEATSTQEKLHLHTENSNTMGVMNVENNVQPNSNGIEVEKNSKVTNVVVRRSKRLKNSECLLGSLGVEVEPVVEHVNLVENKNENEETPCSQKVDNLPILRENNSEREPQVEQVSTLQEVNDQTSLEKKVDYLVRAVNEFKPKIGREVYGGSNDGSSPNFSYKSLYFNSQKKIEALIEENFELVKKLEFARGKIAAYEAMKDAMSAPKEVILVSALGKATDATASLSPLPVQKRGSPPLPPPATIPDAADDSKRKNNYQKKKAKRSR